MRIETLSVLNGSVRLAGTLTLPEGAGPHPVALFLHGSGPLDRDENMRGQRLDIFNRLAEALAVAGIASLRWDKRGCGASGGDYLSHGVTDLVGDGAAWLGLVRSRPELGGVALIGHSEGTLIAPLLAQARPEGEVAAMVLICPFVGDVTEMLRAQAREMAAGLERMRGLQGRLMRLMSRLLGGPERAQARLIARLLASDAPVLRAGLRRIPARSLRDLLRADTAAIHAGHAVPTLALAAEHDIQCEPADAARIAALNPAVKARVLPGISHLLRRVEELGGGGFETYGAQVGQPMDPAVAEAVVGWLGARRLDPGGLAAVP